MQKDSKCISYAMEGKEKNMLETKLNVPFYGHVRQYHNIKAEIDAKIQEVLESGQYVMGPMLRRFEQELAAFHGTQCDSQH